MEAAGALNLVPGKVGGKIVAGPLCKTFQVAENWIGEQSMIIISRQQADNPVSVSVLQCFFMKQSKLTLFYLLLWLGSVFLLDQKSLKDAARYPSGTWSGTLQIKTDIETVKPVLSHWHQQQVICNFLIKRFLWWFLLLLEKEWYWFTNTWFAILQHSTFLNPKTAIAKFLAAAVGTAELKGSCWSLL